MWAVGPLLVCHAALLVVFDLSARPWMAVGLLLAASGAWAWAIYRLRRQPVGVGVLIGVSVVLRLLLLPLPPTLSDDTLRYVWDGRVLSAGFNPYQLAPESEELAALRDERWQAMPHKHVATVYPPLALAVFAAGAHLPAPLLGIKILLVLADLAGCWLLLSILRRLGRPLGDVAAYAWNPLLVFEVAGMGHVDGLMVMLSIAAVALLMRAGDLPASDLRASEEGGQRGKRWISLAGAAAAGGVVTKLVPLVALPLWARSTSRSIRFLVFASMVIAVVLLPVVITTGVPPGLIAYGVDWEFNGPLYEPLWRAVDKTDLVSVIKERLDRFKQADGRHDLWNRFYPFVYPQLLAKLVLGGLFVVYWSWLLWRGPRGSGPIALSGRVFGAVILCAATVYPWYLLWILPWAVIARHRAWLVLAALMPLAYLPQLIDGLELFPGIWSMVWLPFFLLCLLERRAWSTA